MKSTIKKSAGAWIPAFILYAENLTIEEKFVYALLHNLCNEEGKCWPSNGWLSDMTGKNERSVSRYITRLKANGAIRTFMNTTTAGTYRIIYVTISEEGGSGQFVQRGVDNLSRVIDNTTKCSINHGWLLKLFNTVRHGCVKDSREIKVVDEETIKNIKLIQKSRITQEDMEDVMLKCFNDPMHAKEAFRFLTPEYVTRMKTINRYLLDETI